MGDEIQQLVAETPQHPVGEALGLRLYRRMLGLFQNNTIGSRQRGYAVNTIGWLLEHDGSMSVTDLAQAVTLKPNASTLGSDDVDSVVDRVIEVCSGFVTLDHRSQQVRFIHQTCREFLASVDLEPTAERHTRMSRTALTYLTRFNPTFEWPSRIRVFPDHPDSSCCWRPPS
jgi:hypothetical protein